jgi:hypothetical protein
MRIELKCKSCGGTEACKPVSFLEDGMCLRGVILGYCGEVLCLLCWQMLLNASAWKGPK